MNALRHLQKQMQDFILTGQVGVNDSVVQTPLVSVATRLAIYRDGYRLRLTESLTANFPALHAYLGTEAFTELCAAYITDHPSTCRSIRWYGHHFADFITTYFTGEYSFLAELADFEWKMTLTFDAADEPILQVSEMASIPGDAWADLRLLFHPSLHRAGYFWNTAPLWNALTYDEEIPELIKNTAATEWILWRNADYLITYRSMDASEAWALKALINSASFGETCAGLCEWIAADKVGMQAASYLKNWIQQGLVHKVIINQ